MTTRDCDRSNICRMSAIGFGFERAFGFDGDGDYYAGNPNKERARWVDVDVDGECDDEGVLVDGEDIGPGSVARQEH